MAKFAIVVVPFFGHFNPTISVGQLLIDKGHDVAWITVAPLAGLSIPKDGRIFFTNEGNEEVTQLLSKVKLGKKRTGLEGIKYIIEEVLIRLSEIMYDELIEVLNQYKPDIIIQDEQTYSGAVAAYKLQLPFVTTYTSPSGIFESTELESLKHWYRSCLYGLQVKLGLHDPTFDFHSQELGLVFCPKNFSDLFDQMPFQKFVGPCMDVSRIHTTNFDLSKLHLSRQYILVSIGTLLDGEAEKFFGLIINDFKNSPYGIVIAANPQLFSNCPDNFIVHQNLPQLEILKHVDAVITHGGANTVCESVGMGKPLVVIPMAFDQYHLATQIEESCIGIRLKYKRLRPGEIRKACDEILNHGNAYISNVQRLSSLFRNGGGAKQAVIYLENLTSKQIWESISL